MAIAGGVNFQLARAEFPHNLVMTSGASQFAAMVPPDGAVHLASDLTCLDILAFSVRPCNITGMDQISVDGAYRCVVQGSEGWSTVLDRTNSGGWVSIGPPQTIADAVCVVSNETNITRIKRRVS